MILLLSTTSAASEADSSKQDGFRPSIRGFGVDATTSLLSYGLDTRIDIDLIHFSMNRSSLGVRIGADRFFRGFRDEKAGFPVMHKYEAVLRYTTGRSTSISFFLGYALYDRFLEKKLHWPALGAEIRWSIISPYFGMLARLSPAFLEGMVLLGFSFGYFP